MKKLTYVALVILTMVVLLLCAPVFAAASAVADVAPGVPIDLTQIATAVLGVLATLITAFVVPWLRAKLGEANYRMAQAITGSVVKAAEQKYGAGYGAQKLSYVKTQLEKRGITIDVDEIEAAVYNLGHTFMVEDAVELKTEVIEADEDDEIE